MISRFKVVSSRWRWVALGCLLLFAAAALTDARTRRGQIQVQRSIQERRVVLLVLDAETGNTIAGATLNGRSSTDHQGRGKIQAWLPAAVRIRAAGYVPQTARFEEDDALDMTVRLERAGVIGGIAHDEKGKPVGNAEVHIVTNSMTGRIQPGASNLTGGGPSFSVTMDEFGALHDPGLGLDGEALTQKLKDSKTVVLVLPNPKIPFLILEQRLKALQHEGIEGLDIRGAYIFHGGRLYYQAGGQVQAPELALDKDNLAEIARRSSRMENLAPGSDGRKIVIYQDQDGVHPCVTLGDFRECVKYIASLRNSPHPYFSRSRGMCHRIYAWSEPHWV